MTQLVLSKFTQRAFLALLIVSFSSSCSAPLMVAGALGQAGALPKASMRSGELSKPLKINTDSFPILGWGTRNGGYIVKQEYKLYFKDQFLVDVPDLKKLIFYIDKNNYRYLTTRNKVYDKKSGYLVLPNIIKIENYLSSGKYTDSDLAVWHFNSESNIGYFNNATKYMKTRLANYHGLSLDQYLDQLDQNFIKLEGLENIVKSAYNTYLDKNGNVWTYAIQSYSGLRNSVDNKFLYQVDLIKPAVDIVQTSKGILVLLENGEVWDTGDFNHKGDFRPPRKFQGLSRVVKLADSAALLDDGRIVKWGPLVSGGTQFSISVDYPVVIKRPEGKVKYLSSNMYISEDNKIYVYGGAQNTWQAPEGWDIKGYPTNTGGDPINPINRRRQIAADLRFYESGISFE